MPFIALQIILREIFPLRARFQNLETGIACKSAETVRQETPAIDWKAVLRSAGWSDNAAETAGLKNAGDFAHRLPKKFCVFKRLAASDDVSTSGRDFAPMVRIAQDEIDVFARRKIKAKIAPRRSREERAIRSVNVVTSKIDNRERFALARPEIVATKRRHLVVGTLVHPLSVNRAAMICATPEWTLREPRFFVRRSHGQLGLQKTEGGGLAQFPVAVNFAS